MHSPTPLSNDKPPLLQQLSIVVGRTIEGLVAPPVQFSCLKMHGKLVSCRIDSVDMNHITQLKIQFMNIIKC